MSQNVVRLFCVHGVYEAACGVSARFCMAICVGLHSGYDAGFPTPRLTSVLLHVHLGYYRPSCSQERSQATTEHVSFLSRFKWSGRKWIAS